MAWVRRNSRLPSSMSISAPSMSTLANAGTPKRRHACSRLMVSICSMLPAEGRHALCARLKREDVPRFTNHLREVVSRDSTICSCVEYNVPGRGPIPFEVSLQSGRFFGQRGEFEFESGISVFVNPRLRVVNDLASSFRLGINGRE